MNVRFISTAAAIAMCCTPYAQPISNKYDSDSAIRRMDKVWLVTYVNDEGVESLAFGKTATGELFPLIAADQDRLQSIIEGGKLLATSRKIKMRLVEFASRSDVGEFTPP
jgi:hypothetical protein